MYYNQALRDDQIPSRTLSPINSIEDSTDSFWSKVIILNNKAKNRVINSKVSQILSDVDQKLGIKIGNS